MRIQTSFDTKATPTQVVAALTDFSDRRPEIWAMLDADKYEVLEVGETSARVREGSKRPNVWAVEKYDWGPRRVTWTAEESNFCKPGSGVEVDITEGSNGGTHVDLIWHRQPSNLKGWMIIAPMKLVGPMMMKKAIGGALDEYAEAPADES